MAVFPKCFCCSCATEAQLLKHDNNMQRLLVKNHPRPASPFFLRPFFSTFDIVSHISFIPYSFNVAVRENSTITEAQ